jgi:transcriptional regulator with XRE-family HTH domain
LNYKCNSIKVMHVNKYLITFVITIYTEMKERILEFLRAENKSSAQFAEEIGVQPSGISHILSGRNNPSLDFVMKMLDKYSDLHVEWLLFGKGKMYKSPPMKSLFDENYDSNGGFASKSAERFDSVKSHEVIDGKNDRQTVPVTVSAVDKKAAVVKIVWFYADKSFEEYLPGQ